MPTSAQEAMTDVMRGRVSDLVEDGPAAALVDTFRLYWSAGTEFPDFSEWDAEKLLVLYGHLASFGAPTSTLADPGIRFLGMDPEILAKKAAESLREIMRRLHTLPLPAGARFAENTGITFLESSGGSRGMDARHRGEAIIDFQFPVVLERTADGPGGATVAFDLKLRLTLAKDAANRSLDILSWQGRTAHLGLSGGVTPQSAAQLVRALGTFAQTSLEAPRGVAIAESAELTPQILEMLPGLGFIPEHGIPAQRRIAVQLGNHIQQIMREEGELTARATAMQTRFLEDADRFLGPDGPPPIPFAEASLEGRLGGIFTNTSPLWLAWADNRIFKLAWARHSRQGVIRLQWLPTEVLSAYHLEQRAAGRIPRKLAFMTPQEQKKLAQGGVNPLPLNPYEDEELATATITGKLERLEEIKAENTDVDMDIEEIDPDRELN
jgi:hypothetical protein